MDMTTDASPRHHDAPLPEDLAACHAMIQLKNAMVRQLGEQLDSATRTITKMEHRLEQLLRRLYGRSSEKIDPAQLQFFRDALEELRAEEKAPEDETLPETEPRRIPRKAHGRRRIPKDLPRVRVVHDLPEDEKTCPCCGKECVLMGEETSEQLDFEPAKLTVIEHVRLKYACKACEENASESGPQIVTAEKPLAPIEKGLAAPGLLSYVIVSKYGDHLPLYRLERILDRHGIDIARSTMCDWMRQSAEALKPLYDLMVREALASKVLHTDDTPVNVLDREMDKTRTGRFWVYVGDEAHPSTVFSYTPDRSRDGPVKFLDGWGRDTRRYLQADAFGGYDGIYAGEAGGNVVEVACWAHARRKFYEARNTDRDVATRALAFIRLLYDIEDDARKEFRRQDDGPEARSFSSIRIEHRQSKAQPRLMEFKKWLESCLVSGGGSVLPKSAMGQAIGYVLNQWDALSVYATDGDLAIDNNAAENALRRIAIGRKNWLFVGSNTGGHTAAVLFSLIASCDRHKVDPFAYLRDVLTRLAAHPSHRLAELLPANWQS